MWRCAVQAGERGQPGVGRGEEPAEVHQPGGQAGDGLGLAGRPLQFQVGVSAAAIGGVMPAQPVGERDRFRPAAGGPARI